MTSLVAASCLYERKPLRTGAFLSSLALPRLSARTLYISLAEITVVALANQVLRARCRVRTTIPTRDNGSALLQLEAAVVSSIFCGSEGGFKTVLHFTQLAVDAEAKIRRYLQKG